MRPIYVNVTQQGSATATVATAPIPLDINVAPFAVSYSVTNVSGSIRGTVQVTNDDLFAVNFNSSGATWFGQTSATSISGATFGSITVPVRGIRLSLAAGVSAEYSGGATFIVIQGEAT